MALNVSFNFSISGKAKSRCFIRQNHFLLLIASQFLFFSSLSPSRFDPSEKMILSHGSVEHCRSLLFIFFRFFCFGCVSDYFWGWGWNHNGLCWSCRAETPCADTGRNSVGDCATLTFIPPGLVRHFDSNQSFCWFSDKLTIENGCQRVGWSTAGAQKVCFASSYLVQGFLFGSCWAGYFCRCK